MEDLRLTTKDMAEFVNQGYLRFDQLVPESLCQQVLAEIEAGAYKGDIWANSGGLLSEQWPGLGMRAVLDLPRVRAIIESLVGPEPRFDHYAVHTSEPHDLRGQDLHQDAEYDARKLAFDIQASFFFQDIPLEMGGTLFVPGSHFRRVRVHTLARYQHIVGQVQTVCPAGTVVFWHHNIWHSGRGNSTERRRYMFKVRMNPRVPQQRLFRMTELPHAELRKVLERRHLWQGNEERVEILNRLRLWRYLTGDPTFDCASWLARIENEPTPPQ